MKDQTAPSRVDSVNFGFVLVLPFTNRCHNIELVRIGIKNFQNFKNIIIIVQLLFSWLMAFSISK